MKIGIIGAGFTGNMHARIYTKINEAELVGITSKTNQNAEIISKELNAKCYSNYKEMISDNNIDVIDICTPTNIHAKLAIESMENGKNVILEYPATINYKEIVQLKKVSDTTGKRCMLADSTRYQSHYKYVFDCAKSGDLGEIKNLFISRKSSKIFSSSDIVNNLISQDIDFMVKLLGLPLNFTCTNSMQDYACFTFKYENIIAVIEGSTNMHDNYPFSTYHSISGNLKSLDLQWKFINRPEYKMIKRSADNEEDVIIVDYDPYQKELEEILKNINNRNNDADISSILDSAQLTFKCRDRMK